MSKILDYPEAAELLASDRLLLARPGTNRRVLPSLVTDYVKENFGDLPVENLDGGTNADSDHFWCGDGSWQIPPETGGVGPVPNLATWLQAKVTASIGGGAAEPADWTWGNYTITAPIVINITAHLTGFRFDGHGAKFTVGFDDTTKDLIQFKVIDGSGAQVNGLSIANMTLDGTGAALPRKVKNCLTISCKMGDSSVFGFEIHRVNVLGANESGILLYGNVFEGDIISVLARDNDRAGLELRNPTAGGGTGVISSIKVGFGDFRVNKYGIMTSAETTYQEAGGVHITDSDFIANSSAAIFAFAGAASITGNHFENNCSNNAGETDGAIWNVFGPIKIDTCDATSSNSSPQIHLVDFLGQVNQACHISRSYSQNTDLGVFRQTAKLAGNGDLYLDPSMLISRFTLVGGAAWNIVNSASVRKITRVTTATYTVLDTDTHIIADFAGTVTLTLFSPSKYTDRALTVKTVRAQAVVSATANVVPLIGGSAGTPILAATAGKWAEIASTGAALEIMSGN